MESIQPVISSKSPITMNGTSSSSNRIHFMGCEIDSFTREQTLEQTLQWCREGEVRPRTLITLNAALLMMMKTNSELSAACNAGDIIVADGMPIVWSTRLLGTPLVDRVAGVDLMSSLLEAGSSEGISVYFLGAKQEVIDTLLKICESRYPGLKIAGSRNGYFKEADYPEVIREIAASKADILFIGMPTPFKELWGEKYRNELGAKVIFGVGGSFDVIAGYVKRAPVWMQNSGLEWLWRLLMEPRKMWKRYLVTNSQFLLTLGKELVRKRLFNR